MKSMTGFGQGQVHADGMLVRVELSSVNRRNLDVNVSLPRNYAAMEAACQSVIQKRLHRGRIQARVDIRSDRREHGLVFDETRALEALKLANAFAAANGLRPLEEVRDLLRISFVSKDDESEHDDGRLMELCTAALEKALDELETMRQREGDHLRETLVGQVAEMERIVDDLAPLIGEAREEMIAKLRDAVEALGGDLQKAEPRLVQEIALYGERTDIREEVDRIRGHLQQAREKIGAEGPVGRALDFLCQELTREFNTLSVKAARADINRLALEGKERVEMFREQVQNIE